MSMFTELVQDVVADDWGAECGFRISSSSTGEVKVHVFMLSCSHYLLFTSISTHTFGIAKVSVFALVFQQSV